MNHAWFPLAVTVAVLISPAASAKSRPIQQLPSDLGRWSTLWTVIPEEMVAVGKDQSPLAALTWGLAKGTATFVQSVATQLWNTAKPDERRLASGRTRSTGAIFRYEF